MDILRDQVLAHTALAGDQDSWPDSLPRARPGPAVPSWHGWRRRSLAPPGGYRHAMGTLTKWFAWFFRFPSASQANPGRGRFTDAASRQAGTVSRFAKLVQANRLTIRRDFWLFRATIDSSDRQSDSGQTECLHITRYRQATAETPNSPASARARIDARSGEASPELVAATEPTSGGGQLPASARTDRPALRRGWESTCLAFSRAPMKQRQLAHPPERSTPAALPGGAWETMPPRGIRGPRRRTRGPPGNS